MSATNRRAAEAMALEAFDALRPAQQRAILDALDVGTTPRILTSTNSHTRRALERAELVVPGLRDFTPWGLFVYRCAASRKADELAAKQSGGRWNRRKTALFEAA